MIEDIKKLWPDVMIIHGRPRHPQSQGLIERGNGDLQLKLGKWLDTNGESWSKGLKFVIHTINNSVSKITSKSPYEMVFGQTPWSDFHILENLAAQGIIHEENIPEDIPFLAADDTADDTSDVLGANDSPDDASDVLGADDSPDDASDVLVADDTSDDTSDVLRGDDSPDDASDVLGADDSPDDVSDVPSISSRSNEDMVTPDCEVSDDLDSQVRSEVSLDINQVQQNKCGREYFLLKGDAIIGSGHEIPGQDTLNRIDVNLEAQAIVPINEIHEN